MKRILLLCVILCLSDPVRADRYDDAAASAARPVEDRALDDKRHPAEVLRFFGVLPGMRVIDVFAGGGYYSEILSRLVGPEGGVTLYNNAPWDGFVGEAVQARLADDRLPNVLPLLTAPEALARHEGRYDAALFVLGMHDIYYEDPENGWPAIDRDAFLNALHRLLKPGAVLGIVDHNAVPGSDPEAVGKALHRIDPAVVIADLEAAGFVLEARSSALANPLDTLTETVFSDVNRWNTDRSVLRFRRP